MSVLPSLGSGHIHDLARATLDHDVAVLAQSRALHGKGERRASVGGVESDIVLRATTLAALLYSEENEGQNAMKFFSDSILRAASDGDCTLQSVGQKVTMRGGFLRAQSKEGDRRRRIIRKHRLWTNLFSHNERLRKEPSSSKSRAVWLGEVMGMCTDKKLRRCWRWEGEEKKEKGRTGIRGG